MTYTRTRLADVEAGMVGAGAPAGLAHDMVEMMAAQDEGIYDADLAVADPNPTSFRTWCEDVLLPAIRG